MFKLLLLITQGLPFSNVFWVSFSFVFWLWNQLGQVHLLIQVLCSSRTASCFGDVIMNQACFSWLAEAGEMWHGWLYCLSTQGQVKTVGGFGRKCCWQQQGEYLLWNTGCEYSLYNFLAIYFHLNPFPKKDFPKQARSSYSASCTEYPCTTWKHVYVEHEASHRAATKPQLTPLLCLIPPHL